MFETLKTIFFVIPIYLLTKRIYIHRFGDYTISWSMQDALDFSIHNSDKMIFSFIIFFLIFGVAFFMEQIGLPFIAIFISGLKKDSRSVRIGIVSGVKILKRFFKINPFSKMKEIPQYELFGSFTFAPVTFILWSIYIDSVWSYMSAAIVIMMLFLLIKTIKTAIK